MHINFASHINYHRSEILAAVHSQMLQHTERPTTAEYVAVAKKLVEAFPILKNTDTDKYWVSLLF